MPFCGAQVDQSGVAEKVDLPPVFEDEAFDLRPRLLHPLRQIVEGFFVDLHVKVPRVGQDGARFELFDGGSPDDVFVSGDGHEEIPYLRRPFDGHHGEAVHMGLQGLYGIDLGNYHPGSHSPRPHRHAASAPAVPADHEVRTGDQQVRGPQDAVYGALARAVTVVEQVFRP